MELIAVAGLEEIEAVMDEVVDLHDGCAKTTMVSMTGAIVTWAKKLMSGRLRRILKRLHYQCWRYVAYLLPAPRVMPRR
ncbi:MAG: hypothetical protein JF606_29285, partial [Burkholderiales bacterium]|nr:hypothetical protein [Burkholderiales bacterium]